MLQNHAAQHVYVSRKLGSAFDIKDQIKLVQKHDLTYLVLYRAFFPIKVNKVRKLLSYLTIKSKDYCHKIIQHNMYISRKLGSAFDMKDQTKLVHKHDLTYLVICPENTCSEAYLCKTARRLNERIMEHAGKDNKSHMLKHTRQSGHPSVSPNDFRILQKGYNNNKVKRKISEALLIRKHRPSLNIHENSVPLELFN